MRDLIPVLLFIFSKLCEGRSLLTSSRHSLSAENQSNNQFLQKSWDGPTPEEVATADATTRDTSTCVDNANKPNSTPTVAGYKFSHRGWWTNGFVDKGTTASAIACAQICSADSTCRVFFRQRANTRCYTLASQADIDNASNKGLDPVQSGETVQNDAYIKCEGQDVTGFATTTTEKPRIGDDPHTVKKYHDGIGSLGSALYAIGCARKWDHGQSMDEATSSKAGAKTAEQAHAEELSAPQTAAQEFKKECTDIAVKRRQECPKFYCQGTMNNCEKTCGAKFDAVERDCEGESNMLLSILSDKNRVSTAKAQCVATQCKSVGARMLLESAKQDFAKQCKDEVIKNVVDLNGDGSLDLKELKRVVSGLEQAGGSGEDPLMKFDFNKNQQVDYDELPREAAEKIAGDLTSCIVGKKRTWATGGVVDSLCGDPAAAQHGDICKKECTDPGAFIGCVSNAEATAGKTMFQWCMAQFGTWMQREQVDWKTGQPKAR